MVDLEPRRQPHGTRVFCLVVYEAEDGGVGGRNARPCSLEKVHLKVHLAIVGCLIVVTSTGYGVEMSIARNYAMHLPQRIFRGSARHSSLIILLARPGSLSGWRSLGDPNPGPVVNPHPLVAD